MFVVGSVRRVLLNLIRFSTIALHVATLWRNADVNYTERSFSGVSNTKSSGVIHTQD